MPINVLQPILNRLKTAAPDFYKFHGEGKGIKNLGEMFLPLSEIPYFAGKGFVSQFKGAEGKKNLLQGLTLGGGLSGASLGLDYLGNDKLDNKGVSATLGVLGAAAPAFIRGGRSGFSNARDLFNIIKNTNHKGLRTYSADTARNKSKKLEKILSDPDSILNNPLVGVKNILLNKDNRSDLLDLFKPSKGVNIGMLTNRYGGMADVMPALRDLNKRFGKTEFGTGHIINPNIAAMVESGTLAKLIKRIGYERLQGTAIGSTKTIGEDLQKILNDRLEKFTFPKVLPGNTELETLSPRKIKKFLPSPNSAFPFSFTPEPGLKIRMHRGRRARSEKDFRFVDSEELTPALNWKKFSPAQKKWFKSQNINTAKDYGTLVDTAKRIQMDAIDAAEDPLVFLKQYKKQRLENIFTNNKGTAFDFDLKSVAPGIATL